jgi:LmbE family N-acetylglucosaminyl deacetylase
MTTTTTQKPVAFAIAAHPDDIELMMAGTLALLGEAGYELHMMNIANGSCGSLTHDAETIIRIRTQEAINAAAVLGATMHPPLVNDLEIFYNDVILRKLAAVIRRVRPTVILLQSPIDYMEDHMLSARLAASAAFVRGVPNYHTEPPVDPVLGDVTLYHALPWGLRGPLGETVNPDFYVDVTSVLDRKRAALAEHQSQKEWLDKTQGLDSYISTMEDMARTVGAQSGHFEYAEGWRRHLHLGYCAPDADPIRDALGDLVKEA